MSGDSEVSEDEEGDGQGRADGWSECAGRTICVVFGEASELGRPGASKCVTLSILTARHQQQQQKHFERSTKAAITLRLLSVSIIIAARIL